MLALLLFFSVGGVGAVNTVYPGQDGFEKTLAPWTSHQHLPLGDNTTRVKLIAQRDLSEKRMKRVNVSSFRDGQGGNMSSRSTGGVAVGRGEQREEEEEGEEGDIVERALKWVTQIEYSGQSFFGGWDFFTAPDPTHGIINYVDRPTALGQGLAFWTKDGTPGIQVDHWTRTDPGVPRNSVRIHTKALYAGGLFVIDLKLMPWGCGVWPAFWTLGYQQPWPQTGEIDIFEGIQSMTNNQMTIHTTPGCALNEAPGLFSGTVSNPVCDSTTGGSGCSIISSSNTSYGMPFNELGGGVFAMLWDGSGIKMWNWNRAYIPDDLNKSDPNPLNWGLPVAAWDASTCNPYTFFHAQQLILNINLCGDWAGNNYNQYPYCPGTCADYVADPNNLNNTVMLINHIRVYQQSDVQAIAEQASDINNATGVGGPVPGKTDQQVSGAGDNATNPSEVPDWSKEGSASAGGVWMAVLLGGLAIAIAVVS